MAVCKYPAFRTTAGGIVGCGRCLPCRMYKRKQKSTRTLLEAQTHEHILFVTVTYNKEFLPTRCVDPKTGEVLFEHPNGVLDPFAFTKFHKRVRRRFPPRSVRFIGVGEYGEKNGRPHYHFIFFGIPYAKRALLFDAWKDPLTGKPMCDPDRFDVQIPKSDWHVAQYINGYLMKKLTSLNDYTKEKLSGRTPEFCRASLGIGGRRVEDIARALSGLSGRAHIELNGDIPRVLHYQGKKLPIDRYLRGKIIDALSITDMATSTAKKKYEQTMHDLFVRAQSNPKIPRQWVSLAIGNSKLAKKYKAWIIEKQQELDSVAQVHNAEARAAFFKERKKL